jgi:STIP1 family protein 1
MKAYYHLAQAQIALYQTAEALESSKQAHKFCVEEIYKGGKGGSSIGAITELVLKCKKEDWEERESVRLRGREGLLGDVVRALERERENAVVERLGWEGMGEEREREIREDVERIYRGKIEEVRNVFERAGMLDEEQRRRKVPDWCVDDITFSVMIDPVVVRSLPFSCAVQMLMVK